MSGVNNLSYSLGVNNYDLLHINLTNYSRYLDDILIYSMLPWYIRLCTRRPKLVDDLYNPTPIKTYLPKHIVKGIYQNEYIQLRLVVRDGAIMVAIIPKNGILFKPSISYFDSIQIYSSLVTSSFTTSREEHQLEASLQEYTHSSS
jgi:hypothetical protein